MHVHSTPDLREKLNLLGRAAQYDLCAVNGRPTPLTELERSSRIPDVRESVATVVGRGGRSVPLLRIMQTSACEKNCYYCPFRAGRSMKRATLEPEQLAAAFDKMQRRGLVEGLFLSSGIVGTVRSMDRMIATVELVRQKYEWRGYIHLKILPDAEQAQIERAAELADRLSVNLEAPNQQRLAYLAPKKDFRQGLIQPLERAWQIVRNQRNKGRQLLSAGATTQFVVGPAGESDQELLLTSQMLYRQVGLRRAYYSAFSPVEDTPMEEVAPTLPLREHRLYQADFLIRQYGFSASELPFSQAGNLPIDADPKVAWAESHPDYFPLEINDASQSQLLRVPGIGPVGAAAIVRARRQARLRALSDLRKLGVRANKAATYILLDGCQPAHQLSLPIQ
ncbi:MAG: radical SAM protein [Chloroflexota bacterium]|nr:radical SAM protein [Chloroflexota bacterium]